MALDAERLAAEVGSLLFTHSSRRRFAARLNSGVSHRTMRQEIPAAVLALTAELASGRETHATLDSLFTYADAPGDPPEGSKHAKALAWLRRANKESPDPLRVLGRVLEGYMDEVLDPNNHWDKEQIAKRQKISTALANAQLQYVSGGKIAGSMGTPTRTLSEFIRERDLDSIDQEFQRAVQNATVSPREAVLNSPGYRGGKLV